jgi:hypothetical protein
VALFQTVWNVLDGSDPGATIRDYDMFYFDEDTSYEAEDALRNAREFGWRIGVVTNGTTAQQTLKIQIIGLVPYVEAVVISETEHVK